MSNTTILIAFFMILSLVAVPTASGCSDDSDCDVYDDAYCSGNVLITIDSYCSYGVCVNATRERECFHEDDRPRCEGDTAYTMYGYCDSADPQCKKAVGWSEDCNKYDKKYCEYGELVTENGYCAGASACDVDVTRKQCYFDPNSWRCDGDLAYIVDGYCDSSALECKTAVTDSKDCNDYDDAYCDGKSLVSVDGYCEEAEKCLTSTSRTDCTGLNDTCDGDSIISFTGTCSGDRCEHEVKTDCNTLDYWTGGGDVLGFDDPPCMMYDYSCLEQQDIPYCVYNEWDPPTIDFDYLDGETCEGYSEIVFDYFCDLSTCDTVSKDCNHGKNGSSGDCPVPAPEFPMLFFPAAAAIFAISLFAVAVPRNRRY